MSWTQQDTSFKKLQSKRITTSTGKGINEEKGASTLELYLPDIKTEIIPGTPPGASTSILAYTGGTGQTLVVDTSVSGNLTWFATSGYGNTTVANDGTQSSEEARLMGWVSDKYDAFGTISGAGYEVKLYDVNSNLITKTDPSDWLFDYQTGILTFNNSNTAYGTVAASGPYRIVGYRYIGKKGVITAAYGGLGFTTYNFGDILVGAGTTFIKFPLGTNNYILSASSSSSTGLSWIPNTGGVGAGSQFSIPYYPSAGSAITGSIYFTNTGTGISIAYSTASTNTSTGALVVTGGVGIAGTLNATRIKAASKITFEPGTGTSAVSGWTGIGITSISKMIYAANKFVGVGGSYVAYSSDGVNFTYTTIPGQTSSANYGDIKYGNGIFVAVNVQNVNFTAYSYDGASWGTTSIGGGQIRNVGFGNGRFLAPADAGNIVYSSVDGRNWSAVGGLGGYGNEILFANGYFIAVKSGAICYSKDGVSWKVGNTPGAVGINSVTYGKGIYLAADYNSAQYYTSTDLVTWTQRSIDNRVWTGASYVNGVFYLIPNNSIYLYHSLDGINWSTTDFGTTIGGLNKFFTANDRLYFYSTWNPTLWSTDATTGTLMAKPFYNGELENTRIGAVNPDSATFTHLTAFNDVSFTSATASSTSDNGALTVTGGVGIGGSINIGGRIGIGTNLLSSTFNLLTPTSSTIGVFLQGRSAQSADLINIANSSGIINFSVGANGNVLINLTSASSKGLIIKANASQSVNLLELQNSSSSPLTTFDQLGNLNISSGTASTNTSTGALVVTGGVGIAGTLNVNTANIVRDFNHTPNITTIGGASGWVASTASTFINPSSFRYLNNKYIGIGGTYIYYSDDMLNWSSVNVPNLDSSGIADIAYGEGKYVIIQYFSSNAGYSTNLTNWTIASSLQYNNWFSLAYGNGTFVATSGSSPYAVSSNGINWSNNVSATHGFNTDIKFLNGYFYSSSSGSLERSTDGITWQTCNTPAIPYGITYGNGLYVGGVYNSATVVYSYDGLNFSSYTGSSFVHKRPYFFNGVYYITTQNNVVIRYSTDGFNWLNSTGFPGNVNNMVYAQGKLYVGSGNTVWVTNATPGRFEVNPLRTGNLDDVEIGRLSPNNANFIDVSVNNNLNVSSQYSSTSPFNGALTVAGGVGIGGTLNANSVVTYNRLQNQSFSGASVGSSDGRMGGYGAILGHDRILFGNGTFVTNSSWGAYNAAYSTDGLNWTASALPVNQGYPVNIFGNGYFVLSATGATTVLYSTNGISWSQVSIGNTESRTTGAYGNGKYVIVGSGTTYNYSSNLTSWNSGTLPLTADWRIAYGNGVFVAIGYGTNRLIYSYDAINWNIGNVDSINRNFMKITYTNGKFMVTAWSGGGTWYSYDGINWVVTSNSGGDVNNLSYGNGAYFTNDSLKYTYSSDGFSWSSFVNFSAGYESFQSAYGLNKFITGGRWIDGPTNTVTIDPKFTGEINNVRIGAITPGSGDFTNLSSTGSANLVGTVNANNLNIISKINQTPVLGGFAGTTGWTFQNVLTSPVHALTFGNGLFVSIRRNTNTVNISSNGNRWIPSTMPFSGSWLDLVWGKDKFVAVAGLGTSGAYSGDGINWTSMNMPATAQGWYAVAYGDDKFVAVGNTSTAAYSSDGITWSGSSIANTNWAGIAYGNGTFIAVAGVGQSGAYSYDGINWNFINLPSATGGAAIKFITYGNGFFVVTNYVSTAIDYSRDGINWLTSTRSSSFSIHTGLTYGNGIYSILNFDEASFSYDGINWLNSNNITSSGFEAVAYGNNKFVAVSTNTSAVATNDGPSNTLNLHPKFTGDIDNVRIGAKQPAAAEFTNLAAQQPVRFTSNTSSFSINSGALVVVGGVGIGGSLNVNSSSLISGVILNSGVITGSLTGTASTANYAHQSGYAITSGSSALATTAIYSHQSGYGLTSGFATTANYSNQSGYGLTSGFATTANYSNQSGYAITSGSSGTANTSTYSHQSGYATTAGFASTATYSHQSGYAITSGFATTANYSNQSGYAITSGSSGLATTATYSHQSGYATTSGLATTANYSHQSGYGITAGLATTANYAHQSGYGLTSGFASTAAYAYQSGYAITSGSSATATTATNINVVSATTNAIHPVLFTPTTGSASGVALSTESTFVYNPSTDILSVSGLAITSGTASTNTSSGALVVTGGVGIGGTTNLNTLRVNQDLVFTPTTGTTATSGGLLTANFPSFASAGSSMTRTVAFGNGRFVGAAGTSIIWSEDAVNWTRVNNPSTAGAIQSIAFGNGTWVATINGATTESIYSTNNGNSWSVTTVPFTVSPALVFGNGIFVTGSGQYTGISTNGINWSTYSSIAYPDRFLNGYFYSTAYRSPDGINWQALNIPVSSAISYGNGLYFAAQYNSPNYYFSYDGVNFSTTTISNNVHLNSAYYNGVYYLTTQHNNPVLKYSTDGFNYTNVSYPNGSTNYGIAYGNNKIVLFNNLYTEATNYIYYAEASFGKANIQPFREGTIDNVTIGSRIPQAGTFNNVSVLKNLNVNSNFPSVSSNTGALTILGGVGIGGSINIGGRVGIGTNLLTSTFNLLTSTSSTIGAFIQGRSSQTADLIDTANSSGIINFSVGANGNVLINLTSASSKGLIIKANASQSVNLLELQNSSASPLTTFDQLGNLNISSTTASGSTTTGALVVSGGVGIGGSLFVGNTLSVASSTASTDSINGALVVLGGVGIGGTVYQRGSFNSGSLTTPYINQITGIALTGTLTPSTVYYYVVTALDYDGRESLPSAQVSVNTSTNTSVRLQISTIPGARQYRVYRSTTSGAFTNSFIRTTKNDFSGFFYDYGFTPTTGTPPLTNQAFTNKISYSTSVTSGTGNILHGLNIPSGSLSVNTKNDSPLTTVEINGDAAFTRIAPGTIVAANTGGTLTAGTIYYYRHGFVDMRGNESLASDPVPFLATAGGAAQVSWPIEQLQYQVGRIYRSTNIDSWTNTFIGEIASNNFTDLNYPQLNSSPVTTSSSHSYSYISGSSNVSSLTNLALASGRTNFYKVNVVPVVTASTSTAAGTLSTNTTYYYKAVFHDNLGGTSRFGPEIAISSGVGSAINLSVGIGQNQGAFVFRSTTPNFTSGARFFTTGSITDDGSISNSVSINSNPLAGYQWSLGNVGNLLPFNITVAPPSNGFGLGIAANTPSITTLVNGSVAGTLTTGTTYYYRIVANDAFGQATSSSQIAKYTAPAIGSIFLGFGYSRMGFASFDVYRSTDPNNFTNTYIGNYRNNYLTDLGYATSSGSPREGANGAKDIYLRGINNYDISTGFGVISNGFYTRTNIPTFNTGFSVGPNSGTLTTNTDYYYKLRVNFWANNNIGEVSDPIKVNTTTNTAIYLQWTAIEGAQHYSLYRSTDPRNFSNAILINGIKDNFAYDFGHAVVTETPAANYNGSNNVIGDSYGNRLSSLLIMGDNQKLRSMFDAPKFSTYPSSTTGGTLANNTVFFYTIAARGYTGAISLSSSEIRVDTGANNAISLTWLNVNGATGYDIYRSTAINSWTNSLIASNVQSTTFIDINYPTTTGTPNRLNAYGVGYAQSLFENNYNILARTIFGSVNNVDSAFQNFTVRISGNIFRNTSASTLQVGTGFTSTYTFNGSSNGTELAIASGTGFTGSLFDAHSGGTSRFRINFDGSTSIGSSVASTSTATGALIVAGGVGIGNTLYVAGRVDASNYKAWVENRTLSSVDTCVGIGTFFIDNGAHNILISLNVSDGGYSVAKNYTLTSNWNIGGWSIVAPLSSTGAYGNNSAINFQLEAYQGSGSLTLRARSLGTGGSLKIYVQNVGQNTATFTAYNSATSETAISTYHQYAFTSQENNVFKINSSTASTSTSTGALVVTGGVGIGGSLYVASATAISGVTINAGVITGSLTGTATTATYSHQSGYATTSGLATTSTYSNQSGYAITSGSSNTSGFATTATYAHQSGYATTSGSSGFATTASYSHQAGYAITASSATTATTAVSTTSVSVASAGNSNLAHPILITNNPSSGSAVSSDNTFTFNPSTEVLSVSGIAVTSGLASTNSSTGALIITGGVGISGNVNVGGSVNFSSSIFGGVSTSITPTMTFIGPANNPITLSVLQDNSLSFDGSSGQLFSINNNLSTGWIFSISDISGLPLFRTNADGTVSMGEFGGNVGIGLTNPTYKLQVAGNAGIANTLFVSGRAHIGNTSFTEIYGDQYSPIITATDNFDNDMGIQIENISDGIQARASIIFKNDTSSVAMLSLSGSNYGGAGLGFSEIRLFGDYPFTIDTKSTTIISSSSDVVNFSSTKMTVIANAESTSSSTGSLIVSGGAGIAKSLNVGGYLSSKPAYITAGLGADQTLTSGTDNLILFTDNTDPNAWWTGAAGSGVSHRFKPNIAGLYFVSCQVHFKTGSGSGQMNIQSRKNGSTFSISQEVLNTVEGRTLNLSGVVSLDGNTDYVDFTAYTNSSGTPLLTGEANRQYTQAIIYKIF